MNRDTGVTAVTSVTQVAAGKGPARGSVLLGKYRVESTLGFGGMGLVIRAHNIHLDEDCAIKILREDVQLDPDNIKRFVREAKNAVRLKSEHVARIRDVGELETGRPYMVMELLDGLDLGKLLLDHGRIHPQRAVDLILQACDAIAEAHSLGIIHRDIKPTNLFVTKRRDGSDLLKVLDFGISKAQVSQDIALTQTQSMLGTPAYMSPEQMRSARTVDPRSDIWSLGCVLYELVEGHQPFDADNFAELCVMVATEDPAPLEFGQPIGGVLARCLAKTLEERYQNIGELAADLVPFCSDPETATSQVARIKRMVAKAPESRDSTPIPMTPNDRRISQLALQRVPGPAAPPADTVHDVQKRGGLGRTIAVLAVLFAIGIGAGLYVTRQGEDDPAAASTTAEAQSDARTQVTAPVVADKDAAAREVTTARGSDARGNVGSAAREGSAANGGSAADAGNGGSAADAGNGSGSAAHVGAGVGEGSAKAVPHTQPPPPAKLPPKKPPTKLPPKKPPLGAGSGAGSAAVVKPPPKKCDPFENPNGCKDAP